MEVVLQQHPILIRCRVENLLTEFYLLHLKEGGDEKREEGRMGYGAKVITGEGPFVEKEETPLSK